MIEKVEKLRKREDEILKRYSNVYDLSYALDKISKTDRFPYFRTFARELEKKKDHLREMLTDVRERIKKEQNKCSHKYHDDGHNWSYYRCTLCDHEIEC